jgi:alkaline phosphatase D
MFAMGVSSGDPLPDGVVLWTRLAPTPLTGGGMPNRVVEVAWEVAEDEQFSLVRARGSELAQPDSGHSVHAEAGGLSPDSEYFYRFKAGARHAQPTRHAGVSPAELRPIGDHACG